MHCMWAHIYICRHTSAGEMGVPELTEEALLELL
jgi:hypothetical protein